MKYQEYYIADSNGKSNCVIRSLCKILNKEYSEVFDDLCLYAKKLNLSSFNETEVFEKYMNDNNIHKIDVTDNIKIKDLNLDKGEYIVLCYDKKDYYHMVCIIDNILYDKSDNSLELYVINVYKKTINL